MTITKTQATFIGCVAILLWSIDTVVNVFLSRLPIFQVLALSWGLSFVLYALVLSVRREWSKITLKPFIWIIGTCGICGAHFMLVAALRLAPPEQISTMSALWPIFVVIIGGVFLNQQKLHWSSLLGVIVGFFGVFLVITNGKFLEGFRLAYSGGYVFALMSCFLWTAYVIMTRKFAHLTSEMMGIYLGLGGVVAFCLHLGSESFIKPTNIESLLLGIKGCVTLAVSYFCWDFAIKRGHFALLNTLSYFNPIFTISLLTLFGITYARMSLWVGAVLVVIGALLCSDMIHRRIGKKLNV